jgi:hypothetical protein
MAALKFVDVKGYNALLFRRTLADLKLPEALMARSHEWLNGTPAKWNAQEMKWLFPSGATLQFGYLDSDDDRFRYQSSSYQFIGFDELAHFTELTYRFMFSRLRKLTGVDIPLRVRAAGNPGGRGHLWVRRRFIPDGWRPEMADDEKAWAKPIVYEEDELRALSALLAPGEALPATRVFIPSRIDDNPSLDKSSYVQSLYQLDRVTREQMLRGDWSVQITGRQRFYGPAIETFRVKSGTRGEVRVTRDPFGVESVAFYPLDTGSLEVWESPQTGRVYAAGVDTAEGKEMSDDESHSDPDFSVCEISDALSGAQVACLRYRQSEAVFGTDLYALLRWYGSPFLVPEVKGGYGRAMLNKLLDLGYEQTLIFNRHLLGELQGMPPYRGTVSYHDLGWNTNESNRNLMISLLDDAILRHEIEEFDSVGVDELRHFCYDARGKAQAENGWHDDTVIAKALREVARIFAKKLAPMRARQGINAGLAAGQRRKYGQPVKKDVEEERWWREQASRRPR